MKIFTLVLIAVLVIGTASTTFAFADSDSVKSNEEKLQWLETSYSSAGIGVVRAVDQGMNLDPKEVDNFYIYVWSESDAEGISLGMSETGVATGIFEGTVFFSTDEESSGHRLRVYEGDMVYAAYEDDTLPLSHAITVEDGILAMSMIRKDIPSSLVLQSDKTIDSENGTIEWLYGDGAHYSPGGRGIIKLTYKALNVNFESIDVTTAHAWSETDPQGITIDLVETGVDTGIFYADILFTGTGYSSHWSLSVSHGDTVTVSYGDNDGKMSQDTAKIIPFPSSSIDTKKKHMTPLQQTNPSFTSSDDLVTLSDVTSCEIFGDGSMWIDSIDTCVLNHDYQILLNQTIIISENITLEIQPNVTLTNGGSIENYGVINNFGYVINSVGLDTMADIGVVNHNVIINNVGIIGNFGMIVNKEPDTNPNNKVMMVNTGVINNKGIINNNSVFINNSVIYNCDDGTITNVSVTGSQPEDGCMTLEKSSTYQKWLNHDGKTVYVFPESSEKLKERGYLTKRI